MIWTDKVPRPLSAAQSTTIAASMDAHIMVSGALMKHHSLSLLITREAAYKDGKYIFPNDEVSDCADRRLEGVLY